MKKVEKITVLFQILVLYCFVVSLYSNGILASGMPFQNDRSTKETGYFPIAGVDLFTQTTKPEKIVNGFKNLFSFSFKNHPTDFLVNQKAAESYLLNTFSTYLFFSKNIVVRPQRTDIIFPFHYFW